MNLSSNYKQVLSKDEQTHFEGSVQYSYEVLAIYRPFFSYLLHNVPLEVVRDSVKDKFGYTDGKKIVTCYPLALKLTKEEFAGYLEHEVRHILNFHIARAGKRDPLLWNIACDIYINHDIMRLAPSSQGKILIHPNMVFNPSIAIFELSAEQIYDKLLSEESGFKIQKTPNGLKVSDKNGNSIPGDLQTSEDPEEIKDTLEHQKKIVRQGKIVFGELPRGTERAVSEILDHVKIDWKRELKRYVTKYLSDFTYSRRDTRFSEFFIPGTEEMDKGSITIGVGIDLSGSISKEDVQKMLTECLGIEKLYPVVKFTFIPFDVDTYGAFTTESKDDIVSAFKKFKGGGGTSFVKVLKELGELKNIKVILMFTDLYGSFPKIPPKKDVLWLDIGHYKGEVPFGKHILYEDSR